MKINLDRSIDLEFNDWSLAEAGKAIDQIRHRHEASAAQPAVRVGEIACPCCGQDMRCPVCDGTGAVDDDAQDTGAEIQGGGTDG